MKASEARSRAIATANKQAAKKAVEHDKRRAALKQSIPRLRDERVKEIEERFRQGIEYAIERGERSTTIILSSNRHDVLRGPHEYLPTVTTRDPDGWHGSWRPACGQGYLKYAPWGKYVKTVLDKLRRDGFDWVITDRNTTHDDSVLYLNTGGEQGSRTPYYTADTVLTISW